MRRDPILFDLDGTIVDSGAMILASFRHATRTVLAREIPDEQLLAYAGGSRLDDQMRALDEMRVDELVRSYREHNEGLHAELMPCEGIVGVLDRLKREGRRLGIVTSKRRVTVELAFASLPLEPYFDVVVTSDETERHKPDPEPLLVALGRMGAPPERAAYVGDSPFDVAAARAAGIYAVAVSWGRMHAIDAVRAAEPDAFVETPEELLGVL